VTQRLQSSPTYADPPPPSRIIGPYCRNCGNPLSCNRAVGHVCIMCLYVHCKLVIVLCIPLHSIALLLCPSCIPLYSSCIGEAEKRDFALFSATLCTLERNRFLWYTSRYLQLCIRRETAQERRSWSQQQTTKGSSWRPGEPHCKIMNIETFFFSGDCVPDTLGTKVPAWISSRVCEMQW